MYQQKNEMQKETPAKKGQQGHPLFNWQYTKTNIKLRKTTIVIEL